jgi:pyruvate/2-oxoglutarate/acetoin dehydrogenase E1 component
MMDQLVNQKAQMCYMSSGKVKVSMVLRSPCGATNRRAQHTQSFEGIFIHISGLKVLSPSTHYYAKSMIKHAIREDNPPP